MATQHKNKARLYLVEILTASLLVHVVAGIILGGMVLYQSMQEPEPEFVPPPEIKRIQPERLEYKVKMQQQQKKSAKPRMKRIQVESPTNISVPQIEIVAPQVSSEVAVGTGLGGGSGSGNGLGAGGGLGLGKFSVNFFGVKNSGEKIMFLIDASKYMVEDHKGGYPAYSIVKHEVTKLINKMPNGLLFNVCIYGSNDGIMMYDTKNMRPKTAGSAKEVADWIEPINQYAGGAGIVSNNYTANKIYPPMNDRALNWVGALIATFQQQPDTIFWIDGNWKTQRVNADNSPERDEYLRSVGWDEKRLAEYEVNLDKTRQWLAQENANRRAKGQPERVVRGMWYLAMELGYEIPPHLRWTEAQIAETLNNAIKDHYKGKGLPPPSVNQVLFQGPEEADSDEGKALQRQFKYVVKKVGRRGKFKTLEGMQALQNVTGTTPEAIAAAGL